MAWRTIIKLWVMLTIGFCPTALLAQNTNPDRFANTVRLRHAIESTGVQPGPEMDRKLAAMSDLEIERLVKEHQSMGYSGNPLTVIASAILLLILIVLLLVAIVE